MALACERFDESGLRDQLRALVPEFQEQD